MKDKKLKVSYDADVDVLWLAREGEEVDNQELYPGITIEFDEAGKVIGIEIENASNILKSVIEPMSRKLRKKRA